MQTYQFSYKPKKPGIPLYIILLIVLVDSANSQISSYSDQPILDSSRFELEFSSDNYFIIDKVNGTKKYLEKGFLIDPDEEQDETESYVTSFAFSKDPIIAISFSALEPNSKNSRSGLRASFS